TLTVVNGSADPFTLINSAPRGEEIKLIVFPESLVNVIELIEAKEYCDNWSFAVLEIRTVTEAFPFRLEPCDGDAPPPPQPAARAATSGKMGTKRKLGTFLEKWCNDAEFIYQSL
ncbi:MAG: hypothetical protein ACP5EP_05515, partial [Acidobacteriaceae bacterium]